MSCFASGFLASAAGRAGRRRQRWAAAATANTSRRRAKAYASSERAAAPAFATADSCLGADAAATAVVAAAAARAAASQAGGLRGSRLAPTATTLDGVVGVRIGMAASAWWRLWRVVPARGEETSSARDSVPVPLLARWRLAPARIKEFMAPPPFLVLKHTSQKVTSDKERDAADHRSHVSALPAQLSFHIASPGSSGQGHRRVSSSRLLLVGRRCEKATITPRALTVRGAAPVKPCTMRCQRQAAGLLPSEYM